MKVIEYVSLMNDGGAESLVRDYSILLNKRKDFDVKIIATRIIDNSANSKWLKENNIEVIPIFKKWDFSSKVIFKLFKKIYIPYRLKKIIEQENPDCIHVHLDHLWSLVPIRKHLSNIRLIYTCHNEPEIMFSGKREDEYRAACILLKENELRMIALHNKMAEQLNSLFGIHNTMVLYNGIQLDRFMNVHISPARAKERIGISEKEYVIGHVGRFSKQKNHTFLINVFREFVKIHPNSRLLLIGDGNLRSEIEKKIQEYKLGNKVMLLSHRTDIPELMKAMDVFAFPSLYEGLPVTLIEAQVSALHCVVSNNVNPETFITPNISVLDIVSIESWVEELYFKKYSIIPNASISDFDMKDVIERLCHIYSGTV